MDAVAEVPAVTTHTCQLIYKHRLLRLQY